MNFLRRSPHLYKHKKSAESNATSSQESLNSNGFSIDDKPDSTFTDSANENESERNLPMKMTNVPIIREVDEVVTLRNTSLQRENSPEVLLHVSHSTLSVHSTSIRTSTPSLDDKKEPQTAKNRHSSEHKHSDRSSSDFHETSPDKHNGSGDNQTPQCESVGSHGSVDASFDRSLDNLMVKLGEKTGDQERDLQTSLEVSGRTENGSKSGTELDGRKKKKSWYTVLNPSYKSRMLEFRKLFKDVPKEERLIVEYSCAYQKDILIQGRMYLTQKWICFYANIFTWETVLTVPCKDIIAVTKEKTARVIPNAIQVTTQKDKLFFTSFTSRDKAFLMVFRLWQNTLLDKQMSSKEMWQWVHYSYGDQLGLTGSDDDYVSPSGLEDSQEKSRVRQPRQRRNVKKHVESSHDRKSPVGDDHTLTRDDCDVHSSSVSLETSLASGVIGAPMEDGESSGADSPGEVVCSDHDHLDKVYLMEAYDIPVDKVFEFLFSNSKFFRDFCASRKTFDLSLPDWLPEPNADGDREREIRYTLTLSASIGPKHSPSYERQVYHAESQPGFMYVVDAHCYNGGIPYADTFYVTNRYCLTRVTRDSCRVRVSSELRYTKSIWSLVKNMIEKNARHGLSAYFQQLESHLRRESKKYEETSPSRVNQKKPGRRRRKTADVSSGETDRLTSEPSTPCRGARTESGLLLSAENLVRLLCFVLVILFVFNAYLFYKVFYLESVTQSFYLAPVTDDLEHIAKMTQTSDEWVVLLKRQQHLHQMEVDKWRDVLGGAVFVLDQIKATLIGLHETLDNRRKHDASLHTSASRSPDDT